MLAPILPPELPNAGAVGWAGETGKLGFPGPEVLVGLAGPAGPAGPVGPAGEVPLPFPYGGITEGRPESVGREPTGQTVVETGYVEVTTTVDEAGQSVTVAGHLVIVTTLVAYTVEVVYSSDPGVVVGTGV